MYIVQLTTDGFFDPNNQAKTVFQGEINSCKEFLEEKQSELLASREFGADFSGPNKMELTIYSKPSFLPTGETYVIVKAV